MRQPQIVVFERDGRLTVQLRPLAESRRWPLREFRQFDACVQSLEAPGPAVLVIRLGRDVERELKLLMETGQRFPETRTVAVGDSEEATLLAAIAWDLSADFVLFPPLSRELLTDVVAGLLSQNSNTSQDTASNDTNR